MDVFTKKYLHNAVKHAESTLSGNYKSGNNFAKKIEKMNNIRLSKKPLCIVAKWLLAVGESRNMVKVATCGGRVS